MSFLELNRSGLFPLKADNEEDLIVASIIVTIDIVVNVLLICGANKDYSGRRKDLRQV